MNSSRPEREDLPRRPPGSVFEDVYVLGALSAVSTLVLAWSFPLWSAAWDFSCPLREITGIPCPTCYGTRAMLAVVHGEWERAVRLNPLIGAAGIGVFGYVPWVVGAVVGNWPRPHIRQALAAKLAWGASLLVVANWVYLLVAHS